MAWRLIGGSVNKSTLAQVMARHQTGYKPLSEPVMAQFTDTKYASVSLDVF